MKAADTESTRGVLQVIEAIGLPAVLEQCAEELAELAQASLKMARKLRRWLERISQEQKNPE